MSTQFEIILLKLREMLMRGDFESGEHLQEIPLAKQLDASRTPVRLALGALAQEGLLIHKPQRGFMVREFTVREIVNAVTVRGELEAMAARLLAEGSMSEEAESRIATALSKAADLIREGRIGPDHQPTWFDLNREFHDSIVIGCGNDMLFTLMKQIRHVPLAAAGAMAASTDNFERISDIIIQSQSEHETIFRSIRKRQSHRAHALMWEHVYKSSEAISVYLDRLRSQNRKIPLLKLVSQA